MIILLFGLGVLYLHVYKRKCNICISNHIETKQQKEYLVQSGCHMIQGYVDYKPMIAEKLESILKEKKE